MAEAPLISRIPAVESATTTSPIQSSSKTQKSKSRTRDKDAFATKRRCVSTACIACRRRKSKCDGNTPSCAACASVYGTECVYDPNSDHRRKGVYKKDIDSLKTRNSTLQTLIEAILNYPEHEVPALIKDIRTCESLDDVAEGILARDLAIGEDAEEIESPQYSGSLPAVPRFETELSGKMGELRLQNGSVQFVGGTSNLIYLDSEISRDDTVPLAVTVDLSQQQEDPITSWTTVTRDAELIVHLMNMYTTWHYTYFTTLSRSLFFQDFFLGKQPETSKRKNEYCTPLLVNAMLALGCHFTSWPAARSDPQDSATAGDHFFREAKRLILENDEHEKPQLSTVQALALMSVREAGCGREAKGWVYSGMSFRMACDLGLDVDSGTSSLDEKEIDARRITFWGCFLFDKCWSNYLGRAPMFPSSNITVPKFDVFPMEDAEMWSPWTDSGLSQAHTQPSRTRAVALQISSLCEISSDLLSSFYNPTHVEKPLGKQAELKKLSELHTRLEAWRKDLPKEMEPKEGQLPNILVMHMFFHLLYIHLFRPFLKYSQANSPLPAHVSPRKMCTHAAATISKLLRLYKRTYGLRQICNIAVYIAHSACTIHLLNLPEKNARRDIIHGVRQLEEIAEGWLCARRTLGILSVQVRKWKTELPEEALEVLTRTDAKFGFAKVSDALSPSSGIMSPTTILQRSPVPLVPKQETAFSTSPYEVNGGTKIPSRTPQISVPNHTGRITNTPLPQSTPYNTAPQQQQYISPNTPQVQWANSPHAGTTSPQSHASPSALFGGVDSLLEESRDWWLKDQSTLFDNWPKAEPGSMISNGVAAGMNGIMSESVANGIAGFENPIANGGEGLGYMGFGGNSYGYNNGDLY
ncbi:Nitrogen assimilation transcription factor nit-4 [Xylographa bjoerkii]|nr:Nitrogen assimilation transcription factor nit-4 [Xylographa bjoerkii]